MPQNSKDLNNFEKQRLDKIKNDIEDSNNLSNEVDQASKVTSETIADLPKSKGSSNNKIQTPVGTEISLEDLKKTAEARQDDNKEQSKFRKDLHSILVSVSEERLTKITDALKKNILKLERVKDDGSGIVIENKDYVPLTIGQNKKVMKIMKRARLLREDLNGMGADGGLAIGDVQKKYPDILDEDVTQDEVNNEDILNEFIGNYVIAQKAKIYWGIESIENYVLSDLILIIGLYEQRNNFTPI